MNDDRIPTLDDVVRPGRNPRRADDAGRKSEGPSLSEEEIEAIAQRVMERYGAVLEKAIARAIRRALARKAGRESEPSKG